MIDLKEYNILTDGGLAETGIRETRDCTVRAIAIALNVPYMKAHSYLKAYGRRNRCRFNFTRFMHVHLQLGSMFGKKIIPFRVSVNTVNNLLAYWSKYQIQGTYIIECSGHVFALIDGKIHDAYYNKNKKVKAIFKVY